MQPRFCSMKVQKVELEKLQFPMYERQLLTERLVSGVI